MSINRKTILILLAALFTAALLFSAGCDKTVTYKTFILKDYDKRLLILDHPLYSFEYPSLFKFSDVTRPLTDKNFAVIPVDTTEVSSHYETNTCVSQLGVYVEKPYRFFPSAAEKFSAFIGAANSSGDNITIKKITVSGIPADYIEYFRKSKISTSDGVKDARKSTRCVIFEYVDLIWTISIDWNSVEPEPPEIRTYFDHVIETFKILN